MRNPGHRVLLTLLLTQALLLLIAGTLGGRRLETGMGFSLSFPSLADVFDYSAPDPTAADSLLETLADSTHLAVDLRYDPAQAADSPYADSTSIDYKIRILNPLVEGTTPLDPFFEQLTRIQNGENLLVRVGHYGDSQIEGDRISVFLRQQFAADFGGGGMGLLPIEEPTSNYFLVRHCSPNWVRYTVFQNKAPHNRYNYGGTVFHYGVGLIAKPNPNYVPDSLRSDSTQTAEADTTEEEPEFLYIPTGRMEADLHFRLRNGITYNRAILQWGGTSRTQIRVYQGNEVVLDDSLLGDGTYHELRLPIAAGTNPIRIRFDGPSPEIYGLALDPWQGVQVDNLAIRGHSGNELMRIDEGFLAFQLKHHNVKLLVLQYGGNVVPWPVSDYKWLEDDLYKNIKRLQRLAPDVSILVVGVADMARKVDGHMVSYGNIPAIRDAQQRAAQRASVAFWDLYKMMGGRGSIITWAHNNPPMAAQDYAHFSPPGQRLIGQMLYKALMNEYKLYRRRMDYLANPAMRDSTGIDSPSVQAP